MPKSPTHGARRRATVVVALALIAGAAVVVAKVWTPSDSEAEQTDPLQTEVVDVTDTGSAPPAVGAAEETWSYFLHLGTFRDSGDAKAFLASVELVGFGPAISESSPSQGVSYRVRIGPFSQLEETNRVRTKSSDVGFDAAVVRVARTP